MVPSSLPAPAPTTCPLLLESHALLDALGYADTEFDAPHARSAVQQLIRAEMTKFVPSPDYLAFLPDYTPEFRGHPRLQTEYKRVKANVPLDVIDLSRYAVAAPSGKHANDAAAWEAAIKQLQVQLEHQSNHVMSLELQQAYGAKLWKVKAAVLDGLNAQYVHSVAATRAASEATNVKRKQEQVLNAAKLQTYRRKYLDLLDKTHAIKVRIATLSDCAYGMAHAHVLFIPDRSARARRKSADSRRKSAPSSSSFSCALGETSSSGAQRPDLAERTDA